MHKKIIALIAVLALASAPMAFATAETELTPNGVSQGALVNVLYNLQTTVNELAADHDADNATVAELVADHDADNGVLDTYKTVLNLLLANGILQTNGMLLSQPKLAVGTTAGKANSTAPTIISVGGAPGYASAANDFCDATGLTDIVDDYEKVLFTMGIAGTCTVTQGVGALSQIEAVYPAVPVGEVIIGGLEIGDGGAHDYDVATLTDDGGTFTNPTDVASALAASPVAVASVAADLTASTSAADLAADSVLGSGTVSDPKVSLVD